MRWTRAEELEWESRWSVQTGILTLLSVVILVGSAVVIGSVSGDGEAELLRSAHEQASSVTLASVLEAIGFVMLLAPLYFLFRAAAARSDKVRYQLIGLVVAAPLFFAVSAVLNGVATNEAADSYLAGNAKSTLTPKEAADECRSERKDVGAKEFGEEFDRAPNPTADCNKTKVEDDEASNAISEASTRSVATGFALGGRLGLAVALLYSCLWAMRVGLLSRFWGSLGMALGVAALLLLVQFVLIFFIYFGFLLIGRIPGGRPPAWAAGEAIPWPTPGERAAADLQPDDPVEGDGEAPGSLPPGNGDSPGGEPRKRKQRD
jgi:hypothetical protein